VTLDIRSSGTLHAQLYGLPLPTFSLLLVVTSHLVLEVFTRNSLPSNVHSYETLTTFRRHLIFSTQPLQLPSNPSQCLWFVHNHGALFTYLLTYLLLCTKRASLPGYHGDQEHQACWVSPDFQFVLSWHTYTLCNTFYNCINDYVPRLQQVTLNNWIDSHSPCLQQVATHIQHTFNCIKDHLPHLQQITHTQTQLYKQLSSTFISKQNKQKPKLNETNWTNLREKDKKIIRKPWFT